MTALKGLQAGDGAMTAQGGTMTSPDWSIDKQDRLIAEAVERDEPRLRSFIRKRVEDIGDAEDVLQDVFFELTEAYRLTKPIEEVTAWMYRVARNRITDLFRRKKAASLSDIVVGGEEDGAGAGGFAAVAGCGAGCGLCAQCAAGCAG